jgi:hypothetical protein
MPRRSKILCCWRTLTFVPTKHACSALTRLSLPLRNLVQSLFEAPSSLQWGEETYSFPTPGFTSFVIVLL